MHADPPESALVLQPARSVRAESPAAPRRRVLVLAHRFPPTGGAGVQRNLQLGRHLVETGWHPTIVTGPGPSPVEYRWTPEDAALGDARLEAEVVRLAGPEPAPTAREVRLERWFRAATRWRRWWLRGALGAAESGPEFDVVHASVAPFATAEAAILVARRLGKPLVLDLEDPWALDEMLVYPTGVHRRLERRRMERVLRAADAVVMNTPEARRRVLVAFAGLRPDRVFAITNAFDPLDFQGPAPPRSDDRFRIVHTGSLHTEQGLRHRREGRRRRVLGGSVPGVDFLARSHVFLLEAIAELLRGRPELRPRVEVVLAGVFTDEDREVARRFEFVRLEDFVPHAETIVLLRSADLLFLPMHELPAGRRAGIVPHKTYEYLASGRPILAAVPEGDARDLLEAAGSPRLCRPSDVKAMAAIIGDEIARKEAGIDPASPEPEIVRRCDCHRLVRDLASVYDRLVAPASAP